MKQFLLLLGQLISITATLGAIAVLFILLTDVSHVQERQYKAFHLVKDQAAQQQDMDSVTVSRATLQDAVGFGAVNAGKVSRLSAVAYTGLILSICSGTALALALHAIRKRG